MYAHYFGLTQEPFSIAPDPRYLYMSERHREALAHLLYGVGGGGGFVLLSGEIGAGKTTVCRCFLEQVPPRCNVAYIFNPKLTVTELLQSIGEEFRIPPSPNDPRSTDAPGARPLAHAAAPTVKDYLDPLNQFLLRTHAVGQNNVLIIDEAQNLSAEILEQLRLLTNLETNERKLLQIILIGQPELRNLLARPELEQLAQRVIARFHLDALSDAETDHYIRHRLVVAGLHGPLPFDAGAMQRIHRLARGVPRRINLICDRALLGAYATGRHVVDRSIVDRAALEVFGPLEVAAPVRPTRRQAVARAGAVLAGGVLIGAAVVAVIGRMVPGRFGPARLEAGQGGMPVSAGLVASSPVAAGSGATGTRLPAVGSAAPGAGPGGSSTSGASTPPADGLTTGSPGHPLPRLAGAAATTAATPVLLMAADLGSGPDAPGHDERDAWRRLAAAWKLAPVGDPCPVAETRPSQPVQCYRSTGSNLALIRQLDRPGVLTVRDGAGKPVYAVLTGLGARSATLQIGDSLHTVTLGSLANLWRGDFATFWRAPPDYSGAAVGSASGPVAEWLTAQLARLQPPMARSGTSPAAIDQAFRTRVSAFQLAQGLKPDGLAGPTTFMQLNRAIGVDEPHLAAVADTAPLPAAVPAVRAVAAPTTNPTPAAAPPN